MSVILCYSRQGEDLEGAVHFPHPPLSVDGTDAYRIRYNVFYQQNVKILLALELGG